MARFDFTPNEYSPTYDVELDADGNFVALHAVYSIPRGYPESREVDYNRAPGHPTLAQYEAYVKTEMPRLAAHNAFIVKKVAEGDPWYVERYGPVAPTQLGEKQ